jgi:hypothetical protein
MRSVGRVDIPQEAFLAVLHIDGPNWFDNDLQSTTQKTEDSEIFQEKFEDTKEAIKKEALI